MVSPGTQRQTSEVVFPKVLSLKMLRPAQEGSAGPRMRPTELVREARNPHPHPRAHPASKGRAEVDRKLQWAELCCYWRRDPVGPHI